MLDEEIVPRKLRTHGPLSLLPLALATPRFVFVRLGMEGTDGVWHVTKYTSVFQVLKWEVAEDDPLKGAD